MKSMVAAAVLAVLVPFGTADTKLGTGVTLKAATPIKLLLERPEDYNGKTVRIDGVATAICEAMGCWMAVAPEGDEKGATVRLKVDDGVIVFPMTAKGRSVSAEGRFEEVAAPAQDAATPKRYQIKATGAVIR